MPTMSIIIKPRVRISLKVCGRNSAQEQIEKRKETGEYDDLSQYGVTTVVIADAFFQGDGFERFENAIGLRRDDFTPVDNAFSGLNNTVGESDSL